ncbi:hypothetical protein [Methylomonas sp. CM2]|uniref:hypothetical protein n=1 Tax=Methylomonas sp. CM2 TaxID=3417647 RepID=UPI003CF7E054
MPLLSSQPIGKYAVLETSIKLYIESLPKLLALFWILAAIFSVEWGLALLPSVLDRNADAVSIIETIQTILWLPTMLCLFWAYACMVQRFDSVAKGREESFKQVFMIGVKKIWPLFLATLLPSILVGLTGMMMIGTVSFIPMLISTVLSGADNSIVMGISMVIGVVLGAYLAAAIAVSLAFYPYFVVIDALPAYASLQASCKLAWGHVISAAVIYLAPTLVAALLCAAADSLTEGWGADGQTSVIREVVYGVWIVCVGSYFCALSYVQFHDLKLRQSNVVAACGVIEPETSASEHARYR